MSALRRFRRLTSRRKWLALQAVLAVVVASIALKVIRFAVVAEWLDTGADVVHRTSDENQSLALDIGWAVRAAANRAPWPALCLVQALAATMLARLHRLNTVLYLGVARGEAGELLAHAWLRCGDRIITGAPSHERFRVVATFSG